MLEKIFRKELELNKKWWHKLFKIIVLLLFVLFIWNKLISFWEESFYHYKEVDKLEVRLTDKVSKPKELLKSWERFTDSNWQTEKNYWEDSNIYCSNRLDNIDNIKYIINETWIDNFNRLRKNKNNIDIESFSMLLRSTQVKCITVDNAEIDFLNPMREFDDYGFYKKSKIQYIIDSLYIQNLLINLFIYSLIIYILYYQILLRVIYKKKYDN